MLIYYAAMSNFTVLLCIVSYDTSPKLEITDCLSELQSNLQT
jgi:hypothetical protein